MADNIIREAEDHVLSVLKKAPHAVSMDDVIKAVTNEVHTYRAVELKIAAMNLVSQGRADLNNDWALKAAVGQN